MVRYGNYAPTFLAQSRSDISNQYGQSYRDTKKHMSFVDMGSGSTPMAAAFSLPAQTTAGQVGKFECPWSLLTSLLADRRARGSR
jgi:hypothetical protein